MTFQPTRRSMQNLVNLGRGLNFVRETDSRRYQPAEGLFVRTSRSVLPGWLLAAAVCYFLRSILNVLRQSGSSQAMSDFGDSAVFSPHRLVNRIGGHSKIFREDGNQLNQSHRIQDFGQWNVGITGLFKTEIPLNLAQPSQQMLDEIVGGRSHEDSLYAEGKAWISYRVFACTVV